MERRTNQKGGRRSTDADGAVPITKRIFRAVVAGLGILFTVGPGVEWLRGVDKSDSCTQLLTVIILTSLVVLYLVTIACDYQTRTYTERIRVQERLIKRLEALEMERARKARKGAR